MVIRLVASVVGIVLTLWAVFLVALFMFVLVLLLTTILVMSRVCVRMRMIQLHSWCDQCC